MIKEARATTSRHTQEAGAVPNLGALAEFNERAFEGAMKAGEAMIKGMAALSEEMFSFVQNRLREDLKAYQTLIRRCGSPGEVYDCQRQFAERATFQYLDMAKKLTSLGSQIAGSAWPPPEAAMAVAAEKAPLRSRASTRPTAATQIEAVETIAAGRSAFPSERKERHEIRKQGA